MEDSQLQIFLTPSWKSSIERFPVANNHMKNYNDEFIQDISGRNADQNDQI
ncbi:15672_t:CDS:2 [Gigaspora rosea]|nr:15672_t:CDS:2 [Gigaspora rosea]